MVLREPQLVATLLLFLFISTDGASISTRINSTADDNRAAVPLVVSIPSKVFRANKLNTNDVFERPILFEPAQESRVPTKELLDSQQQQREPFATRRVAETTKEATSFTEATTSTTVEPFSTRTTTTTTTEAPSVSELEAETEVAEVSTPVTTSTTTEPSTTEETTTSSSSPTEKEVTSSPDIVIIINVTSTTQGSSNLDDVVEKDYGQSLGINEQSGVNGKSEAPEDPVPMDDNADDINPEPQESESDTPPERADDTPPEVVADESDDGVVEVDALDDEVAQGSELDYAVVSAPLEHGRREEARDLSALMTRDHQGGGGSHVAEHRSVNWAVEDEPEVRISSTEEATIEKNSSNAFSEDDVRTSMSYSVAVVHPLGEFEDESTPVVAVPMIKTGHRKKALDESSTFLDKKTSDSFVKTTTDSIVVLTDSKHGGSSSSSSSEDDNRKSGNSTLLVLDMTPEDNNGSSSSESELRSSQNTFYRRRHQPWKTSGQVKDEDRSKDLVPEESVQESVLVLDPSGAKVEEDGDSAVAPSETVGVLDGDDPDLIPDEGEYEYVYEYIDLNSTDLPENLPEGAVILTEDQLAMGQLKPPGTDPVDVVVANTSAAVVATEDVVDGAQPATFRTLNPPLAINTADLSLTLMNLTTIDAPTNEGRQVASEGIHQINEELPVTSSSDEGTLPFIPGMPESPIYFVGIQREKIDPGSVAEHRSLEPVKDGGPSPLSPNSLAENKPQAVQGRKGGEEQLMSLYALSQALPLDHTSPFLNLINDNGSSSVILPADLPDPFSEEFLGDTESNSSVSATEEIITTEPVTVKIVTTSAAPSTTEPETVPTTTTEEPKPTDKVPPSRGSRPRGSRRSTTVASTAADGVSTTTTSPPVAETSRRTRPTRIGGRRRTTTTTTTASVADASNAGTEPDQEKVTTENARFSSRKRGRFSANRGNRPNSAAAGVEPEGNGQKEPDKESNTIAPNGVKRTFTGRRTTAQPSSDANNATDKDDKPTRGSSRPARGRRPTTARIATKATEEKVTSAPADGTDEATEGVTRKAPLFRPRNRGRFGPKAKGTTNEAETVGSTEQSVSETEETELKEESTAQEGTVEPEVDSADGTTTVVDDEEVGGDEGAETTTETNGPPRKFPPRFRPGSRATIPHRTTEPSA